MFHSEATPLSQPGWQSTFLRPQEVARIRGRSRSAHYADIKAGLCVKPVKLGPRASGTPGAEIARLNAAVLAGKSESEIKELVRKIEAARAGCGPLDLKGGV